MFSGVFYPVSPRQLLQSDTGVPHFALDPLTLRCLLSLSPTADFPEPRPPHHSNNMCKKNVQTGCTGYVHIAAMRMVENNECFTVY